MKDSKPSLMILIALEGDENMLAKTGIAITDSEIKELDFMYLLSKKNKFTLL